MRGDRECSAATSAGVGGVHVVAASPDLLHRFLALLTDPWVIFGRGGRVGGRRG